MGLSMFGENQQRKRQDQAAQADAEQLRMAAPMIDQARFGTEQTSRLALQGLSQIDNPAIQEIAARQTGRLQDAMGNRLTPLQQEQLETEDIAQRRGAFDLARSEELFPGELGLQRQELISNQLGIEQQQADLSKSLFDMSQPPAREPINLKDPQLVYNPYTGQGTAAFLPGTEQFNKVQTHTNSVNSLLADVAAQRADLEMFGTERWNDEAVGRMQSRQAGMLIKLNTAREAGVPSGPELELAAQSLPDPTGFASQFRPWKKDKMLEQLRQTERELTRQLLNNLQINPMQEVDWAYVNPNDVSPELQEYYKANRPTISSIMIQRSQ